MKRRRDEEIRRWSDSGDEALVETCQDFTESTRYFLSGEKCLVHCEHPIISSPAQRMALAICAVALLVCQAEVACARTTVHHLVNTGRDLVDAVKAPVLGAVVIGPTKVAAAYQYEVHGREQPENRDTLRGKLFGLWRAPGEEMKGIITGLVNGVSHAGDAMVELISIIWGD